MCPTSCRSPPRVLTVTALVAVLVFGGSGVAPLADPPPRLDVRVVSTSLLQPDPANGTDTFLLDMTPMWNYGDDGTLVVGFDPANGSVGRSLLRFDLSSIPAAATILGATLELYSSAAAAGSVLVRPAAAPWTEGDGDRSWSRLPITVTERAGIPRTLEPVEVDVTFPPGSVLDPASDVRVWASGAEVPSQARTIATAGPWVTGARIVFGATVGAFESRVYDLTYAANGTAAPAYRTRTFSPTELWTYGPTGGGGSSPTVADLDGDGTLEILFGGKDGFLHVVRGDGALAKSVQLSATRAVIYAPQVTDIDGDGLPDIIVVTNEYSLVRLNRTVDVQWTRALGATEAPYSTPTLLDVDADGVLDVLIGGRTSSVEAYSGIDGSTVRSYVSGSSAYTASIANVTGDPRAEIFFGSDDRLVHAYEIGGTQMWSYAPPPTQFPENAVALGDVDGDGSIDVVTVDDTTNGPVFALRGTDGSLVWAVVPTGISGWREGGVTLADINGDGGLEVLVGAEGGTMLALRGADGQTIWSYTDDAFQPLYAAVVDLTNDGTPEIVFFEEGQGGVAAVRVLNSTGVRIARWNVTANDPGMRSVSQFHMITPAVADVNGDGTLEIVAPTGDGLKAFGTGGLSRDWRTWGYNWNHTNRGLDGSSPDGAPFLDVSFGSLTTYPPPGATWTHRDGVASWVSTGGDFSGPIASSADAGGWVTWNVTGTVAGWQAGTAPNVGLFLTEADEASGGLHRFASSDDGNVTVRPRLRVTYDVPVTDPVPRITGVIPDISRPEDSPPWALNLAAFAEDDDTPASELRWILTGANSSVVGVTGTNVPGNHVLGFYPQRDAWGPARVTYWLTDPQGNVATQVAWLNITPVNDPPAFNPPPTLIVRYNATYVFDFRPYLSDVDDPLPSLTLTTNDPEHTSVSGFNVSFTFSEDYLGQWAFVGLTVSDGRASTSRVVAVKVTDDRPPVLARPLPDLLLDEGEFRAGVFDLDDYFTDPDNDSLYFSEGYSHLNITIHANHSVDVQAELEWSGWELVTFRGTDPEGAIAEDAIVVTVQPIDDPPTLGPVPDLRVRYDEAYPFDLSPYIADPDTPLDGITVNTSSPYIAVSGRLLSLLYPFALNGTIENVTLTVSDGTTSVVRTIRVTVGDDRPPRLIATLGDRDFLEDSTLPGAYNLSRMFEDPDSAQLFYSSGNREVLVTINAWGSVDLSASRDWFGTERITLRATDDWGALAEDTVWIRVLAVNDAPTIEVLPALTLNVTSAYVDLSAYVADIDNDLSDLTLSTNSLRATPYGLGLLLTFTGSGSEDIEVTVSDGTLLDREPLRVVVELPGGRFEPLPPYVFWVPIPLGLGAFAAFIVYRRRKIQWAFLVTNVGILVSSVSRREPTALDTDVVTGMLTTIMDFAKRSFSDERERELEGLELGDERVAIVRGDRAYLAVVYQGRTPGSLTRIMKTLLDLIETNYADALGDIVDSTRLGAIPNLLQRLISLGWWPFLTFTKDDIEKALAGAGTS